MFGNLSKSLIKAPHYFNINIDTQPNEHSKLSKQTLLDTYSHLRRLYTRNPKSTYFKESDYSKKNLKLDLNYNNNFRKEIIPLVKTKKCISFEEFFFNNSNKNSNNNKKNETKHSYYQTNMSRESNKLNLTKSVDSKISNFSTQNPKLKDFLQIKFFPRISVEEFDEQVKTNVDSLIERIKKNSLNFTEYEKKKIERNGKKRIETLKEYINKDTVVETPIKLKFPVIRIKSNDTLYREAMDNKINSLSMISPKIKEQLKSKKRVFASKNDFYRYNNSYSLYKINPFEENAKYIEEIKKKEII